MHPSQAPAGVGVVQVSETCHEVGVTCPQAASGQRSNSHRIFFIGFSLVVYPWGRKGTYASSLALARNRRWDIGCPFHPVYPVRLLLSGVFFLPSTRRLLSHSLRTYHAGNRIRSCWRSH